MATDHSQADPLPGVAASEHLPPPPATSDAASDSQCRSGILPCGMILRFRPDQKPWFPMSPRVRVGASTASHCKPATTSLATTSIQPNQPAAPPTPFVPTTPAIHRVFVFQARGTEPGVDWHLYSDAPSSIMRAYDNQQPTPMNVRQAWPAPEPKLLLICLRAIGFLDHVTFTTEFPDSGLTPTGRYQQEEYLDFRLWIRHVWEVWQALLYFQRDSSSGGEFSLQAMLTVVGQGMVNAAYKMPNFIRIQGTTVRDLA